MVHHAMKRLLYKTLKDLVDEEDDVLRSGTLHLDNQLRITAMMIIIIIIIIIGLIVIKMMMMMTIITIIIKIIIII